MTRFGIKFQILMIVLIPIFIIDLFFTSNQISNYVDQAHQLSELKSASMLRQLVDEFHLLSDSTKQIQTLLDKSIIDKKLLRVAYYDRFGELLAESISPDFVMKDIAKYSHYRHQISTHDIAHSNLTLELGSENYPQFSGWLDIYISTNDLVQANRQTIYRSLVYFITILLLALALTFILNKRITQPILGLKKHLQEVESGRLGKSIKNIESNEIGSIQKTFNSMTLTLLANKRHLNRRIEQATQQLSETIANLEEQNRRLELSHKTATEDNQSKSEHLANMSHEIRTPLNGILGFIKLLGNSKLNTSQQHYVEIVLKSAKDLSNIINEILDISKIEKGKLQVVNEEFDLHAMVEQTRDILIINVLSRNIDLNLIIYSDTPRFVIGDKLRLKQILLNLIGNAIKFTDKGQVVITVSIEDQTSDESLVVFSVEDSGVGIAESDQQNLFKAFSQVGRSDTRHLTGTGLGLVISKELAWLMGGDISMHSELGKGSKFNLRLALQHSKTTRPTTNLNLSAMIFAANKHCLMETRSLYDRAGVHTEACIIDSTFGVEEIKHCIQVNMGSIDLIVFDLRKLKIDLQEFTNDHNLHAIRIIVMHYDRHFEQSLEVGGLEFISIVNTSQNLAAILAEAPSTEEISIVTLYSPDLSQVKKVLFVDDNKVNLTLGCELIRLWGHLVSPAENAKKAMSLYRKNQYDIIILDIQMPDIDGKQLFNMMRELKPNDATPIVALTANALDNEEQKLLDFGFDYYLSKPIDEDKFRQLLSSNPKDSDLMLLESSVDITVNANISVDFERSLSLSADNDRLLIQIFDLFLQDIPDYQSQLIKGLHRSSRDTLNSITHKLQGVTCYISLPKLRKQVIDFQQRLITEDETSYEDETMQIVDELNDIKQHILEFLSSLKD